MPIRPLNKTFKYVVPGVYRPGEFGHLLTPVARFMFRHPQSVREDVPIPGSRWAKINGEICLVMEVPDEEMCIQHYKKRYGQLPGLGWFNPKPKNPNPDNWSLVYVELLDYFRDEGTVETVNKYQQENLKVIASSRRVADKLHRDTIYFHASRHITSLDLLSAEEKRVFNLYMRDHPEQLNWVDCWLHSKGQQTDAVDKLFWNKVLVQQMFECDDIQKAKRRNLQKPTRIPAEVWTTIYVPCGYGHRHEGRVKIAIEPDTAVRKEDYGEDGEMEFLDSDFWLRVLREAQREKAQMDEWSQEWQTQLPLTWPAIPLPRYYYNKWHKVDKKAAIELGFKIDEGITSPLMDPVIKSLKKKGV